MEHAHVKRRLTCILAADAVGYSSHMSADEEGTVRILAAHRAVIDGIVTFHDGRIVGTAGDSVLAEFASAVSAVRCASEIQEAIKTRNDALPASQRLLFRVGVNLGDVVVKDQDLLGDGVNIASRLETLAEPGGICISSSVYEQITGKLNLGFLDIGEQTLKNIGRPVRVYRVGGAQPAHVERPAVLPPTAAPSRAWIAVLSSVAAVTLAGALAWSQGWLTVGPRIDVKRPDAPAPSVAAPAGTVPIATQTATSATPAPAAGQALNTTKTTPAAVKSRSASTTPAADSIAAPAPGPAPAPTAATTSPIVLPPTTQATTPPSSITPSAQPVHRFDGNWDVHIRCDGGPGGAEPYVLTLAATVSRSWLRAERGADASQGGTTLLLDGLIAEDGSALLKARGQTGDPRFSMDQVRPGTRYGYEVNARFDGSSGSGTRTGRRTCDLRFERR